MESPSLGTAPGWFVEKDGHIIVAMPGVPHEMFRMWKEEAEPKIVKRLGAGVIHTRIHKVLGIGESQVEEMIDELIHSTNPTAATYAKTDGIYVRVSAKAESVAAAEALMAPVEARLGEILGDNIYATDDDTLVTVNGRLLQARALRLGVMEYNTGGLIASQPVAEDAKDVAEALAHMLHLATGALERAGLGPLHRAIVDDGHDAVFTRTDGELVVSLALPRATDPTQGLLDVNRLWSATLHELGLAGGTPAIAPPATPVNTPVASDSTGAPHAPQARARAR